jgi:hypothetical protein
MTATKEPNRRPSRIGLVLAALIAVAAVAGPVTPIASCLTKRRRQR